MIRKRIALALIVLAAILIVATLSKWGPSGLARSQSNGAELGSDSNPMVNSTIQFAASSYSAAESSSVLTISVTRSGDLSGSASATYATSDGAGSQNCNVVNGFASPRCDYISALGTIKFAAGESTKTITIHLIDDSYPEGNETFNLSLSNPSGAVLGSLSTANVTIIDNDASATGVNPIDNLTFYVKQQYVDFLNREPDPAGLSFWINEVASCGANVACAELKHVNVSAAFFVSIEFQQTGYLVERMYKSSYGDASGVSTINGSHQLAVPVVRFNEFLSDTQEIGDGVIVGQSGWETLLENNKQAFAADFVQRPRFAAAFATSMTPSQFVNQLFANAGVTPSASDRQAAIDEFGSVTNTSNQAARARALRRVAENSILNQQEVNRAFVLMQYYGYLRRNPNDNPDPDYSGYDFWLTKLNQFNGNYINAEMVKAFITSTEYRQRFGP